MQPHVLPLVLEAETLYAAVHPSNWVPQALDFSLRSTFYAALFVTGLRYVRGTEIA